MALRNHIVLLFISSLGLICCRKDPEITSLIPVEEPCCECDGNQNPPSSITMGDTSGMTIRQWDTDLLFQSYDHDSLLIDLESDGEADFFIINYSASGFGGSINSKYGWIGPANDSGWVSGSYAADTMYTSTIVSYSSANPVIKTTTVMTTCYEVTCCDSVAYFIDHLNHSAYQATIEQGQDWISDGYFRRSGYTIGDFDPFTNPDTTYSWEEHWDPSCNNLTPETPYIPIKKISCGQTRLGWVKLQPGNPWKLVETAIQR